MLNKIYLKIHDGQTTLFYVESKNFDFDINKVYDINFNKLEIDEGVFDKSCQLIKRNILTGENQWECDGYDIALGTPIKTPPELL